MTFEAKRIVVHGRVQGVGFRYFVRLAARDRHLRGNVRNRPDSAVEIEVEGPAGDVAAFIQSVKQGPPLSRVERMEIQDLPAGLPYKSFLLEGQ